MAWYRILTHRNAWPLVTFQVVASRAWPGGVRPAPAELLPLQRGAVQVGPAQTIMPYIVVCDWFV